jgi:hypothetical protein
MVALKAALNLTTAKRHRKEDALLRMPVRASPQAGRQLSSSIDRDYPYLNPAFALLQGSAGIQPRLKRALQSIPEIEAAWLAGRFAKADAVSAG